MGTEQRVILVLALVLAGREALAQTTERVSVSSAGVPGNTGSSNAAISADGRYVAFHTSASSLVPGDTNTQQDVFVHDRDTGITTRVSVTSSGEQATGGGSDDAAISADGRFVAFRSHANNLVPGDTNSEQDIFVHDRMTSDTVRVSVGSASEEGDQPSHNPSISGDGRFVAFESHATNLVPGDTNERRDIFVHDRDTDGNGIFDEAGESATARVSVDPFGFQGNNNSFDPSISGDGRYVVFWSDANNLAGADRNGVADVFLHDRQTGHTSLVSLDSFGQQAESSSSGPPSISSDGRYVAFRSNASLDAENPSSHPQIYVRDLELEETFLVSRSSSGEPAGAGSSSIEPSISDDGKYVAFRSNASNLVSGDTNGMLDIFFHDLLTLQTIRVSVSSSGDQANNNSERAAVSADGRCVAFDSSASNLVLDDTNLASDVFVRDLGPADDRDCNGNGIPDFIDIEDGTSLDLNGNAIPDECERDCNGNGIPDFLDIIFGVSGDENGNGIPDECEDCNGNGIIDDEDIAGGASLDCDANGIPDECQIADGTSEDCNLNGVLDECDIGNGSSPDFNGNGIPDECEPDCNGNGIPDFLDIAFGASDDTNGNGIPDECEPPPEDINADCVVNVLDLIELLLCFGQPAVPPCDTEDINGDGTVDVLDLIALLLAFGASCP